MFISGICHTDAITAASFLCSLLKKLFFASITRHPPLLVEPQFSELVAETVRTWVAWPRSAVVPSLLLPALGPIPHSGGVHPSVSRDIRDKSDLSNSDTSRII